MRLLIDMSLTPRWVQYLNAAGHNAVHWSILGPIDSADAVVCAHARDHGYVLLTNDLDFPRILAHTLAGKPSIVLLRGEPLTPELRASSLLNAIAEHAAELDSGAILSLDWLGKPRARLLPLS